MSSDLENSLTNDVLELALPKILPKLEPAFRKLSEFLGKDEKRLVLQKDPDSDQVFLIIIKTSEIQSFDISNKEGATTVFPINEFLELLMQGDIESLMTSLDN